MCLLGTKTIWNNPWHCTLPTLMNNFLKFFHSLFQPLAFNTILVIYIIKLQFFPIILICLIYTTHLYFTMTRGNFSPNFMPNTLESMIEYTLISSILEKLCEMTTKPWECQRDDGWLFPLQHLLEIKTWGKEWKRIVDKIDEWVA
jgi:hypothetical protein